MINEVPNAAMSFEFARLIREATDDTATPRFPIRGYQAHLADWLTWCGTNGVEAEVASVADFNGYYRHLASRGVAPELATIKSAALRWFYQQVVGSKLRRDNPAATLGISQAC
jgi:site-specific recombinase XerD